MPDLPFTSLRYPISVDPALGRIAQEQDFGAHVEQLVLQVLMTAPGERINRPDFGCGVRRLLFAPASELSATLAQAAVYQALTQWLPDTISLKEVTVRADGPRFQVRVGYVIKARGETRYLNVELGS